MTHSGVLVTHSDILVTYSSMLVTHSGIIVTKLCSFQVIQKSFKLKFSLQPQPTFFQNQAHTSHKFVLKRQCDGMEAI